jgi:type 1 glutamine amidotransferase
MEELVDTFVVSSREQLYHLDRHPVIVLNGDLGPLNSEQEQALCTFVEHGGGLVCLGDAVEAYHECDLLSEVLGHVHGICAPRSEIIVHVATTNHYMTRRVDPSFAVLESIYLLDVIPPDAEVLWRTSWHYTTYTLAYTRQHGQGRIFCTTLGSTTEAREHPVFVQMVARAVQYRDDWLWRDWLRAWDSY